MLDERYRKDARRGICRTFAIDADSLGSIVNPVDCCVTGLRAIFGRAPVASAMPLTPSVDRVGALYRFVAAIIGRGPASPTAIAIGFEVPCGCRPQCARGRLFARVLRADGFGAMGPASTAHWRPL